MSFIFYFIFLLFISPVGFWALSLSLASLAATMPQAEDLEANINRPTNKNPTQKRHVRFQEQDGLPRVPGSRPSSAPAEPNAKAAKKAYKKMEKEQR